MPLLLAISRAVDALTTWVGKMLIWMILAATLISAGNAIIRKLVGTSSNAWLEAQWYLFAAVFMLGGGYAFLRNAHVRIDFVSSRFSPRTRNLIDVGGIVFFLFPLCYMMGSLGWPVFHNAWVSGEVSSNAGGLLRWPVYLLLPVGFALLALQGLSELIKRVAFLTGHGPDVLNVNGPSEEEQLAAALAAEAQATPAKAS